MTVWICQCLCPDRHAIMSTAGEANSEAVADLAVRAPLEREIARLVEAA